MGTGIVRMRGVARALGGVGGHEERRVAGGESGIRRARARAVRECFVRAACESVVVV
jgi:hypothetical protein